MKRSLLIEEIESTEEIPFRRRKPIIAAPAGILTGSHGTYSIGASITTGCGGTYSIAGGVAGYNVYIGVNVDPDLTAAPTQFSTTLPIAIATTPPGSGTKTYNFIIRKVNEYGLESQNQNAHQIIINSAGVQVQPALQPPDRLYVCLSKYSDIQIIAAYPGWNYDEVKATGWRIWVSLTVPNVLVDTPDQSRLVDNMFMRPFYTGSLPPGDYNIAVCLYRSTDGNQSEPVRTTITIPAALSAPGALP